MTQQLALFAPELASVEVVANFGGHQGLVPRWIWLRKAFDRTSQDPNCFNYADAPIAFGMTARMLKAVRFWAIAFKIIEERGDQCYPTAAAQQLLGANGSDPYLEDEASYWLLHWWLFRPPCYFPSLYYFFNKFYQPEFSRRELLQVLLEYKQAIAPKRSNSVIEDDARCLLAMYTPDDSLSEDSFLNFLHHLRLIYSFQKDHWFFRIHEDKPNLPPWVVAIACLDYMRLHSPVKTVLLSELLYQPGSPGQAFKLSEHHLIRKLEKLDCSAIHLTRSGDFKPMLAIDSDPEAIASELMKSPPPVTSVAAGESWL